MCHGRWLPELEYHQLIEWNHRLFAVLGGALMVVTVGATLLWYRRPRRLVWMAVLAGATYVAQAVLGGITVLLDLDHTWVAAHMGNSMLLLGSLILLALFARHDTAVERWPYAQLGRAMVTTKGPALKWIAAGTLAWTYVAMFTGSAVVGTDAPTACPAWPQCSDASVLPTTFEQWVSFGHRIAVGLSDVLMLALAVIVYRTRRHDRSLLMTTHFLAAVYLGQVFVGAFTVWLGAPEWIRAAHLAMAAATWGVLVALTAIVWFDLDLRPRDRVQSSGGGGWGGIRIRRLRRRAERVLPEGVRAYWSLMRMHVIPLLLVPAAAAMLIAAVQHPPERPLWELVAWTMLGGTLAAGGAHAINQYLERDLDARMKRTARRPVVTGRIAPRHALAFGVVLSTGAVLLLWLTVNPPAALLSLGGNLFYVVVYTMWLKRTTVHNIVIGGAAGAVPPLVGWAAVTGGLDIPALLFFAIIFFWTPPHFWALALVRQDEYRRAGIPMLPVVRGEAATRTGILHYALLLVPVTLLPFATGALGPVYVVSAMALGLVFIRAAAQLARKASTARAWQLFRYSNIYLALLYLAMVVDRLLVAL
jgi:protoheme IX farnesyltransferase